MPTLFEELKRRNVFRVAIAYVIVGWVVMQVAEFLSPLLRLPDWTVSMALYIGILGFPFAMLFTWAFELTPQGLKRSTDVHPDESISHETGSKLNLLVIGLMALVIAVLMADRFLSSQTVPPSAQAPIAVSLETPPPDAVGPQSEASNPGLARSIAVLPFVNMSNDPEQEYFSDGISEELLNALAKISELRVAARTSSFAFKGKNQDITNIGDQLKVETVLEGSVRKSGERLRITAQLINVEDGFHLWSETYDRKVTDIFVIQDEISAAIIKALRVHLAGGEAVAENNATNVEAYNFYLMARHNLRRRTEQSLTLAVKQYQQAIDIDPAYAAAWAGKALATDLLSDRNYGDVPKNLAVQQAQMMLDMAFSLDSNLGIAHAANALLLMEMYQPQAALASLELAIAALPSEGILYSWKSNALSDIGQQAQAFNALKTGFRVDPLHQTIRHNLTRAYVDRRKDAAARALSTPGTPLAYLVEANIADRDGHYADVIKDLKKAVELSEDGSSGGGSPRLLQSLSYFFALKNVELAQEGAPETIALLYQSIVDPEAAYAALRQMPGAGDRNSSLAALVYALIQLQRYEEALSALQSKEYDKRPLSGDLFLWSSDIWLAYFQAYCQKQLGREEEALALAGRIGQFIEFAVSNGEPPYYFTLLAAVQSLTGDDDAAMQSLLQAKENYNLSWADLDSPIYASLQSREDFQGLTKRVQDHLNEERARLAWAPVEI
jgi:TolB-like protein